MIVYSKRIIRFIEKIKKFIKQCISSEIGLKVSGKRFYDTKQRVSYPIIVVIFNNKSKLGYFDPSFLELGFHECLMNVKEEQLYNIIRHELAHFMMFISHGPYTSAHSPHFRAFCIEKGWGEEVYRATTKLDYVDFPETEENSILRKVQKLMALSTSCNVNESEQAMIKAQQLLLKHNIDSKDLDYEVDGDEDKKYFLKRIMQQTKENAKMRAIATILGTFFVNVIYTKSNNCICLEITGSAVNIEIAEYVASVLDHELERLWERTKKEYTHLKGLVAKNSFIMGIAKGYCTKINHLQTAYQGDLSKSLMIIEKQLLDMKKIIYPHLTSRRRGGHFCPESSMLGELAGQNLNINPAVNQAKNSEARLIYAK